MWCQVCRFFKANNRKLAAKEYYKLQKLGSKKRGMKMCELDLARRQVYAKIDKESSRSTTFIVLNISV